MFPFTLDGPGFLAFFVALAGAVVLGARHLVRAREGGAAPGLDFDDPYRIAFLRGGAAEAVRVAIVSLADRGLLDYDGDVLHARGPDAGRLVRHPLERALVELCASPTAPEALLNPAVFEVAEAEYGPALRRAGLLPDDAAAIYRLNVILGGGALMAGVVAIRVHQTLAAGRGNLMLLLLLALAAAVVLAGAVRQRLTALGAALLADLRTLFADLRARAAGIRPGGATVDAVLLAAVFGLQHLPAQAFPLAARLRPRNDGDSGGGGDGGSSSSDSGCGGCGGGGCGG